MTAINLPEAIKPSDHKTFDNTSKEIDRQCAHAFTERLAKMIAKDVFSDQEYLNVWCESFSDELDLAWEMEHRPPTPKEMAEVYLDSKFLPRMVRAIRCHILHAFDGGDGCLLEAAAGCLEEWREK